MIDHVLESSRLIEEGEIQPGFAERGVLHEAFSAIKALTYNNKASANFIAAYGGIEAAIAAMEAFPCFAGSCRGCMWCSTWHQKRAITG
jgi:hypothetical protein